MIEQHEVVLLIAEQHREQWLHGVLSHCCKISLQLPELNRSNQPVMYLVDDTSYTKHQTWFENLRLDISPESPALLRLSDQNEAVLLQSCDEVIHLDSDAEHVRERIEYWIQLRDSLQVWWLASSAHVQREVNQAPPTIFHKTHPSVQTVLPVEKLPEIELETHSSLMSLLFDVSSQGMFVSDLSGRLLRVNSACASVFEYSVAELIGQNSEIVLPKKEHAEFLPAFLANSLENEGWEGEVRGLRHSGDIFPMWLTLRFYRTNPKEESEKKGYFVGIVTDLSVSRMLEESVLELSRTDSLSELNRVLLEERLSLDIRYAERNHRYVAVLYLNLRRFRMVNERFGYAFGDWVLMAQLQRLRNFIGTKGMVSRLFANNYVIVLPNLETSDEALKIAHQLIDHLSVPLCYDHKEVISVPNIGVAYHPGQGETATELLRHAELAMDWCRQDINAFVQVFDEALQALMQNQIHLEAELWKALQNKQFFLEYQPQYCLMSGNVPAVEALIRWQKDSGVSYPKDFILFAEENDLIIPISNWVIREACEQAKRWLDQGTPMVVSVNISALHFDNELLVQYIAQVLQETQLPPHYLDIEVTESCIMKEVEQSVRTLNALKALGVSLSVDDFGTGYSSLSYLKLFPINKLKIDRSFISDLAENNSDAVIVRAIIALGQAMGLIIVAEGVETEDQFAFLQEWHCDFIQGYLFMKPQREANLLAMIHQKLNNGLFYLEQDTAVKPTLLLVDDEQAIINAIKRSIRSERYNILSANSAAEALDLMAHHEVGVILTDNRMPGGSGIDLLRNIKQRFPDTTRIMLSGYSDFEALSAAINAGEVYRFIGKPWDDTELKQVIREGFVHYEEHRVRKQMNAQSSHVKDVRDE